MLANPPIRIYSSICLDLYSFVDVMLNKYSSIFKHYCSLALKLCQSYFVHRLQELASTDIPEYLPDSPVQWQLLHKVAASVLGQRWEYWKVK